MLSDYAATETNVKATFLFQATALIPYDGKVVITQDSDFPDWEDSDPDPICYLYYEGYEEDIIGNCTAVGNTVEVSNLVDNIEAMS